MSAVLLLGAALVGAVPDLTERQQSQLDTATDDSATLDEAAWYPLLQNALQWSGDARPGSTYPDYEALLADPAAQRGALFLIQGRFAGLPRDRPDRHVRHLARPGPWARRLEQWGVVVDGDPQRVVLAYLTDPPAPPRAGARVEIVARFYKIWRTLNLNNEPTRFAVFVGRTARVVAPSTRPTSAFRPLIVLVVILGAVWIALRLRGAAARPARARAPARADATEEPNGADADDGPPLPVDPAAALAELKRRGHERGDG